MNKRFRFFAVLLAALLFLPLGFVFGQQLQVGEEIKKTRAALTSNPSDRDARSRLVGLYYKQGVEDLRNRFNAEAVRAFQEGLAAGLQEAQTLPANAPEVEEARYALAYALVQQRNRFGAIPVLETLVADSPDYFKGRYLLGVTLVRTMEPANVSRGLEVLRQIARETSGDVRVIAVGAGTRLSYNVSTVAFGSGRTGQAVALLENVVRDYGNSPGETKAETSALKFALGTYLLDLGDFEGALFELLFLSDKDKGFTLNNGVTVKEVLANAYYETAVDALSARDSDGAERALDLLKDQEKLQGSASAEVHHGRALAHQILGDRAKVQEELQAVKAMDESYYRELLKAGT